MIQGDARLFLIRNQQVAGSIPAGGSNKAKDFSEMN